MMTRMRRLIALTCLTSSWLATTAQAQPEQKDLPKQAQQAKEQVTKYLDKVGGLKQQPIIAWLDEAALKEVFPSLSFFAVRYRQYPVAIAPPEGLGSSNVIAVDKEGKLHVLKATEELPKYFPEAVKANMGKMTADNADKFARAWLSLAQELVQDGFYKFEIMKPEVKKGDTTISVEGRSLVTQGGKGHIGLTIQVAADGTLKTSPDYKIQPGPRPICQALKLLDSDATVRYMAYTELLFMGQAARPYLLDVKSRTTDAQLRQAINHVLERIDAAQW